MPKCVIPKKRRSRVQNLSTCVIRIGAEQYQAVLDICDDTGRSINDVSSRLLDFALENVEIAEG